MWRVLVAAGLVLAATSTAAIAETPTSARGEREMVATAHPLATEAGLEILARGGNAADAAVAVAFALAVVYPRAGNLGGGGFLVYAPGDGGEVRALDFRETAPAAAHAAMYLDDKGDVLPGLSLEGWLAVGVPGTVRGLAEAHRELGRLPWKDLVLPAWKLASAGFPVDRELAASLAANAEVLARDPEVRRLFFHADGPPLAEGETLRQEDLAQTLTEIADQGGSAFYVGRIAERLAAAMVESGGLVTPKDLAGYRAIWRAPISIRYRGLDVYSMPPPSSGGICLGQLLRAAERLDLSTEGAGSATLYHLMIEAERRVYADRSEHLGDPDFHPVPVSWLLGELRTDEIVRSVDRTRATRSADVRPGIVATPEGHRPESEDTTHFSIVDADGNAASVTTTLNADYGAGVIAPGTGFFLNDEMDDFATKPGAPNLYGLVGGRANSIEPGKRMLSSMTPTVVRKDGKNYLVLGTPGGSTIITTVFQVLVARVDFDIPLSEAVGLRRVHHQWVPDSVFLETPEVYGAECLERLAALGHQVVMRSPIGNVQAIEIDPATGERLGVADPRAHGLARGR